MTLLKSADRNFVEAVSKLIFCNPFMPERIEHERRALGDRFVDAPLVWSLQPDDEGERPNIERLTELVEPMAETLRERLASGGRCEPDDVGLYEDLVLTLLYHRYRSDLQDAIVSGLEGRGATGRLDCWRRFRADFKRYLELPRVTMPTAYEPAHLFACFYQIRRAFYRIFRGIVGGSMPAARLRASVWQSIFTHDLRRYARVLYQHMGDMTTLVTGPSGTGKELVARAIGQSRYIPFDPEAGRFTEDFAASFFPLNLSALSPTLIESELFGHKRGSFTGAVSDRTGWLEVCPALGTVFLDEVGDLDPSIQVKLLRVLETRTFQRLGETTDREFGGKVIAATNRDLAEGLRQGQFRADFYYRICSDIVTTPPLAAQLVDDPRDLHNLVLFIAQRIVGVEAERVTGEVVGWIEEHLGHDYPWPGNIRELEQCVCNVVIRRRYEPPRALPRDAQDTLADDIRQTSLTAQELLGRYCTLVYAQCGSYEEAARRLAMDRRTVKARVDPDLLERLAGKS
jgi:transcriptional regulator with AAA-type ATPase domain